MECLTGRVFAQKQPKRMSGQELYDTLAYLVRMGDSIERYSFADVMREVERRL